MIAVSTQPEFAALAAELERRARAIGEARAKADALARTAPANHWRRADLLWPNFTKG